MLLRTPIRTVLLLSALMSIAFAQNEQTPVNLADVPPGQRPSQTAAVTFSDGRISVAADNSSLNQILHDISQKIGMKITGGVNDERVYGNYGPAVPATVIAQLINGTGSNMLLIQASGAMPTELLLTPRNGGPTPPSPGSDNSNSYAPVRGDRVPVGGRFMTDRQRSSPSGPPELNGSQSNVPQSSVPQPSGSSSQSPSGTKTPQQIFNELQAQRRQQMQQGQGQNSQ